jgi:hypothetical protein
MRLFVILWCCPKQECAHNTPSWYNPDRPEDRRHHFVRRRLQQTFNTSTHLSSCTSDVSFPGLQFHRMYPIWNPSAKHKVQFCSENCLKLPQSFSILRDTI